MDLNIEKAKDKNYQLYIIQRDKSNYLLKIYNNISFSKSQIDNLIEQSNQFSDYLVKIVEIEKNRILYDIDSYFTLKDIKFDKLPLNKIKIVIKSLLKIIYFFNKKKYFAINLNIDNIIIYKTKPLKLKLLELYNQKKRDKNDYYNLGELLFKLLFPNEENFFILEESRIDNSLKILLKGLLTKDSSKRWKYREVLLWFQNTPPKSYFILEDFIFNDRVINDKTLLSCFKRDREGSADDFEKEIINSIFDGRLEAKYQEYKKSRYKRAVLKTDLKKIRLYYRVFDNKNDTLLSEGILKYLEIVNYPELYILPTDFEKENFSLFQIKYIITKEKFEEYKKSKNHSIILEELLKSDILKYIDIILFLEKIKDDNLFYIPFDFYNKLRQDFKNVIKIAQSFIKKEEIEEIKKEYYFPENIYQQTINLLTLNSVYKYRESLEYINSMKRDILIQDFDFIKKLKENRELLKKIGLNFDKDLTIEDLQKIKNIQESEIDFKIIKKLISLRESNNKSINIYLKNLKEFNFVWKRIDKEIILFFDRSEKRKDNNIDIIIFGIFISLILSFVSQYLLFFSISFFSTLLLINNFFPFSPSMPSNLEYQNRILEIYRKSGKK